MEELKNKAKNEIGKPILNPLGWFLIISLIATISFPFVWLWYSLWMATKISLTGLLLMIILGSIYRFIQKKVEEAVDNEFEKNPPTNIELGKSKFRQKLDKMMQEQSSVS